MFVRCNSTARTDCKGDDEFEKWLKPKYILIRENTRTFVGDEFGKTKISEQSKLEWLPVNQGTLPNYIRMITR